MAANILVRNVIRMKKGLLSPYIIKMYVMQQKSPFKNFMISYIVYRTKILYHMKK